MSMMASDRGQTAESSLLRAVMETVADGVITIDEDGIVNSFNPAAERIFGYGPGEVIGETIQMLMPEPYQANHDDDLANSSRTGPANIIGIGREISGRRKDGSTFPLDLAVREIGVGDRRMLVGILRDMTERKAAEAQIEVYRQAVERSNQELDEFAYIASHDLKEPLRGLANNATFLKEDYATKIDAAGVRRLDRIIFLCHRMERLVNDLLYFSRIGRQELAIGPADLNEIIEDVAAMMKALFEDEQVEFAVPRPLPTVICDVPRVTELFRNLVANGIKYNKSDRKRIEIGFLPADETGGSSEPVYFVRDNGIGIAAEFHQDMFRLFKRLNNEDDAVKGTGVGLTYVKKIVERHGGRIWVESRPGAGSTFYFTLNSAAEVQQHE